MTEQTLQLALILMFLVLALFVLPGVLFIRLVAQIVERGLQEILTALEERQAQTLSSPKQGSKLSSAPRTNTPTTQADPASQQTESTKETR